MVTAVPAEAATMLGEKLENLGLLYGNESDPVLQELWFLGRYHGQYHLAEGSNGRDEDWENRRFRIGGQARLLRNLTVHAQMVSGREMDPIYNGFRGRMIAGSICSRRGSLLTSCNWRRGISLR